MKPAVQTGPTHAEPRLGGKDCARNGVYATRWWGGQILRVAVEEGRLTVRSMSTTMAFVMRGMNFSSSTPQISYQRLKNTPVRF